MASIASAGAARVSRRAAARRANLSARRPTVVTGRPRPGRDRLSRHRSCRWQTPVRSAANTEAFDHSDAARIRSSSAAASRRAWAQASYGNELIGHPDPLFAR